MIIMIIIDLKPEYISGGVVSDALHSDCDYNK